MSAQLESSNSEFKSASLNVYEWIFMYMWMYVYVYIYGSLNLLLDFFQTTPPPSMSDSY